MLAFTYDKAGIPSKGIKSLLGENKAAFASRVKREAEAAGETAGSAYSRFSGFPSSTLAKAWQGAVAKKESTLDACVRLNIDVTNIGAWRSACLAVKPDAKLLPEPVAATTQQDSAAGLTF